MQNYFNFFRKISGFSAGFYVCLLLGIISLDSAAQAAQKPAERNLTFHPKTTAPHQVMRKSSVHGSVIHVPNNSLRTAGCDTDLVLDYGSYNQALANLAGISFSGSWVIDTAGLYINPMTSTVNTTTGNNGDIAFAGVLFDSLAFGNPLNNDTATLTLAGNSIYLDSVGVWAALQGDSTAMYNDSILFYIYSSSNGILSDSPVQTVVVSGWPQLSSFWQPANSITYNNVAIHQQFNEGEGFAVVVQYINKDSNSVMDLAYSYEDSCIYVYIGADQYYSPAYPTPFQGNDFWDQISDSTYGPFSSDTAVLVEYNSNQYGYFSYGFPDDCSFVYPQNWAIIPMITLCSGITITSSASVISNVSCYGDSSGSAAISASGGIGSYSYSWSNGQSADTGINLSAGAYIVTVSANGFSAFDSLSITQPDSALAVSVAYSADFDSNGVATATASGGALPYTYVWSNGDSTASIDSLAAATYYVTVTDNNGCVVVDSATIVTGINSLSSFISDVSLFPNPANESLTVSVQTANTLKIQLRVTDVTGKIMYAREQTVKGKMNQQLDLTPYASGVYFLELISGQQSVKKSFVVTH
jgi:hypothetical protein